MELRYDVLDDVRRDLAIADASARDRLQLAMIRDEKSADALAPSRHHFSPGQTTEHMPPMSSQRTLLEFSVQ